jgi:hypothetical protein
VGGVKKALAGGLTRRAILRTGLVTAAAGFAELLARGGRLAGVHAAEVGPATGTARSDQALQVRQNAAEFQHHLLIPDHPDNGDEALYANKIGNYSKGLPHNNLGEVDLSGYESLIHALSSGQPSDFEAIPLGSAQPSRQRKLVNPQAGLAFDLEGSDSHLFAIPPAPALGSAQAAGEMVELYWMALARDVHFADYATNRITRAATADLSLLPDFRGPKIGGAVTPDTLFRGFTAGDMVGPYVSQFLWKPAEFGVEEITQKYRSLRPGADYLTGYADWLAVQNGETPQQAEQFDRVRHFVLSGRDLAAYVHIDVLFQAYFNACLILFELGVPFNPGNPYTRSATQAGFGTFGGPHGITLLTEVATRALKAIWYQKWFVHRRLRPEEFGGRVHNHLTGAAGYPLHPSVLNSRAVHEVFRRFGSYLLPQAYPEGSPLHPSYGAGHATVAGACVTILKAFFDESFVIPDPVIPGHDGVMLRPYTGPGADRLTVGGELNKLAANIATGRNFAGIHWRTDYSESLRLGEAMAISMLRDQRACYNEEFSGFTFTKFDGTTITV